MPRSKTRLILLLAAALMGAAAFLTCSPGYVLRAGYEEAKILSRRRPIVEVARDPDSTPELRRKLQLVLQARTFAEKSLGLAAGESYTTFSRIDRDTLALVLSAAHKDRFQAVTWWFPIVGRVPYKGYFALDQARKAAAELEEKGFDAYIRPTSAFSTLGWFNDPLLSTVVRADDVGLVSTVIHEIAHNTLFIPSRIAFNESFANFVGDRGAVEFFCGLEGEDGERCREARAAWADNLVFGAFLSNLIAELEELYARPRLTRDDRLRLREDVFRIARDRFAAEVTPQLRTRNFRGFDRAELNNARLISIRLYYDRLELFEALFQRQGGDLPRAIQAAARAARASKDDPYAGVASLL